LLVYKNRRKTIPTAAERIYELKTRRSRALDQKLNIVMAKIGSDVPEVKSMVEENDFNLGLLFGASKNENINWTAMGPEGLIRCYYEIINRLKGTVRNNILKAGITSGSTPTTHNTTCRSGIESGARLLLDGRGYQSGFFIGWNGMDDAANNEGNMTIKQIYNDAMNKGLRGEFDVPMTAGWTALANKINEQKLNGENKFAVQGVSTSFTTNIDQYQAWNDDEKKLKWIDPPYDKSRAIGRLEALFDLIGEKSDMTKKSGSGSVPNWRTFVNDSILGQRFRNIYPYKYRLSSWSFGDAGAENQIRDGANSGLKTDYTAGYNLGYNTDGAPHYITSGGGEEGGSVQTNDDWYHRNYPGSGKPAGYDEGYEAGYYDRKNSLGNRLELGWTNYSNQAIPDLGYTSTPDAWSPQYISLCQSCITVLNDAITWINRTRVTNFTYFVNPFAVPGIDPNYDIDNPNSSPGTWQLQAGWVTTVQAWIDYIQGSINRVNSWLETSSKGKIANRNELDQELTTMKNWINTTKSSITSFCNTLEATLGDVANPASLRGTRFLWVRTLLHSAEGSTIELFAADTAIDTVEKKLVKSQEELAMFGIVQPEKWIPDPDVIGIEAYPVLNQATLELEIGGWLVAYNGQKHCTAYNIWKSMDYNPNTKTGSWTLIDPTGRGFTQVDTNANTGQVLKYIIDTDVEPIPLDVDTSTITHPYYKVKAYDNGEYHKNPLYHRAPSASQDGTPMNPAAFPSKGQDAGTHGPTRPGVVTSEVDSETSGIPPNTLFWVTNFKQASDTTDYERRVFTSEAPFDSQATNLMVFVDGKFKNQAPLEIKGDYELLDKYRIRFYEAIPAESEVNLIVALRSFAPKTNTGGGSSNIKDSVGNFSDLPIPGQPGDIRFVENPPPGQYYEWVDPPGEWRITNKGTEFEVASSWKTPVNSFSVLPSTQNVNGDIRLVLDTNIIYRYDGSKNIWAKTSGSSSQGWFAPVNLLTDLDTIPRDELVNGTLVYVVAEESLYRWNSTLSKWVIAISSGSANWKNPVNTFTLLPTIGNAEGDVRLTLNDNKIYRWIAVEQEWKQIVAKAQLEHNELMDKNWSEVIEHDARYYPRSDIDTLNNILKERLDLLDALKPKDADNLHGTFTLTGSLFNEGYLSSGSNLRFETLAPHDHFTRIIKSGNFILGNNNSQQFSNGDIGIIYCYINGIEVDNFNLGSNFQEKYRDSGQIYPKAYGHNHIIEILSVSPYNQYNIYQRADFQLHITKNLLASGENKIRLSHHLNNAANNIYETDDLIIFADDFEGEMGFKEISITQKELNSSKYLSGIRYYSIGDKLEFKYIAENLFNNTYIKDKQIYFNTEEFGINPEYINYSNDKFIGNKTPEVGKNISYQNEIILNMDNVYKISPTLYLKAKNSFKEKSVIKKVDFLINTVTKKSTDTEEIFLDEYYRLPHGSYNSIPSLITEQWNSQNTLTVNDLQVYNGALIYPQGNYTKYMPVQNINYSTATGIKYYYRAFKNDIPCNNGKFKIDGFSLTDPNIKIDIKLPSLTGWMSLNTFYNAATFTGNDLDGCLINNISNSYEWTSGEYSTADSGYMIIIRVTLFNNTNSITKITLDKSIIL
jgi:hypothetical protein